MPKIKWVGLISEKDVEIYQNRPLPDNAQKMKMPQSIAKMMICALPFAVPAFITIFLSMFLKTYLAKTVVIDKWFVLIGLVAAMALLFVHELLHACVFPKDATVFVGIVKPFSPVALCSKEISKPRFVAMSLLPYVLVVAPLVAFCLVPPHLTWLNGLLFGLEFLGLVSPYPDVYNVYQVLKQTPPESKVFFYQNDTYFVPQDVQK